MIEPTQKRLRLRDRVSNVPLMRVMTVRDFKLKYKQSVLGQLWLFIQPFGMLLAFTVVFNGVTQVDTSGIPYTLFALTGLIVWTFVQGGLLTGVGAVTTNHELVRRVPFPYIVFTVTSMVKILPNIAVTVVGTIIAVYALGETLPIQALLLPLALVWVMVFIGSLINFLGAIAVYARDPVTILPFALQIGLFISPVAYPADAVSGSAEIILALNPITGLIEAVRWCILPLDDVNTVALGVAGVWTVVAAVVGWHVFARLETSFADSV